MTSPMRSTLLQLFRRKCFVVLVLVLFLPTIEAVCGSCFGQEPTCRDNGFATCPWQLLAGSNTAALAAAGTTMISLTMLLPARLLRVFTSGAISALVGLYRRPREGREFDLAAATPKAIIAAVSSRYVDKQQGMMEISDRLLDLDPTAANYHSVCKGLEAAMAVLTCADGHGKFMSQEAGTEGSLSFIIARLSVLTNKDSNASFDMNVVDAERDAAKDTSSNCDTSSRYSANLTRAKSLEQVCCLLNLFVLVACSAGVTSLPLIAPFLDEVFYEPIRTGEITWPVAFEMVLLYIRMVETQPSLYNLGTVIYKTGGIDAKRKVAASIAEGAYPKAVFFRVLGGKPKDIKDPHGGKDDQKFTGSLSGFNTASKRGCVVHNMGGHHLAKYVQNGKCQFFHGCDQHVKDKGTAGQCLSTDHVRARCDYDATQKCSHPCK